MAGLERLDFCSSILLVHNDDAFHFRTSTPRTLGLNMKNFTTALTRIFHHLRPPSIF